MAAHWVDGGPSGQSSPVTTSDTAVQPAGRGIFVGTGGTIVGQLIEDTSDRTFKNLVSGQDYPLRFKFIKTASTATDLLILH
jgi:hypothetical protein